MLAVANNTSQSIDTLFVEISFIYNNPPSMRTGIATLGRKTVQQP